MTHETLLTPREVATILNVTTQTLWRWRQLGKSQGPEYVRLGKTKHAPVRYLPLTVNDMAEKEIA